MYFKTERGESFTSLSFVWAVGSLQDRNGLQTLTLRPAQRRGQEFERAGGVRHPPTALSRAGG